MKWLDILPRNHYMCGKWWNVGILPFLKLISAEKCSEYHAWVLFPPQKVLVEACFAWVVHLSPNGLCEPARFSRANLGQSFLGSWVQLWHLLVIHNSLWECSWEKKNLANMSPMWLKFKRKSHNELCFKEKSCTSAFVNISESRMQTRRARQSPKRSFPVQARPKPLRSNPQ